MKEFIKLIVMFLNCTPKICFNRLNIEKCNEKNSRLWMISNEIYDSFSPWKSYSMQFSSFGQKFSEFSVESKNLYILMQLMAVYVEKHKKMSKKSILKTLSLQWKDFFFWWKTKQSIIKWKKF